MNERDKRDFCAMWPLVLAWTFVLGLSIGILVTQ